MRKVGVQKEENLVESNSSDFPKTNFHSICIPQFIRIDNTYRFFCRHWEIHLFAPFLFLSIITFVFTINSMIIVDCYSKKIIIISFTVNIFFLVLLLISYFAAMCMDPGFLPFYWPAIKPSKRKFWYNWEEQLNYLAIYDEQFEIAAMDPIDDQVQTQTNNEPNEKNSKINFDYQLYEDNHDTDDPILVQEENAKEVSNHQSNDLLTTQNVNQQKNRNHSKLHFASFSRSSGRFVIRADHICGWISNWVGKRNHKQFILFTLYGGIFSISLISWRIVGFFIYKESLKQISKSLHYCDVVVIVCESLLILCLISFFINQVYELSQGRTQIQRMKNSTTEKKSCMYEMRQVCGDGSVFCWICPTPAFGKELYIEGYS